MGKISVVINTINEEKNLPRALSSVKNFADEIVVVDMHSEDDTVKIAKKHGAKVFTHKRTGYVEPARNYAVDKATGDWVLVLDADEKLPEKLANKLIAIVKKDQYDYVALPRKNIIFGKWMKHSRWWPDYNVRFFKKGHVLWDEAIHSVPTTQGRGGDLKAKEENAIVHYHYDSIDQFVDRLNRYTTHQAKVLENDGYKFKWSDLISKPADEFLSRYFYGEGYKEGIHGLALAGLQAFSEFVLHLKVWQLSKFEKKNPDIGRVLKLMRKTQSDFNYWQADTLYKEKGGLVYRVKRKLKLP